MGEKERKYGLGSRHCHRDPCVVKYLHFLMLRYTIKDNSRIVNVQIGKNIVKITKKQGEIGANKSEQGK